MEEVFNAIREKFFWIQEDPYMVKKFKRAMNLIEYPRNQYNVLVFDVGVNIDETDRDFDPFEAQIQPIFKHGPSVDEKDERYVFYMTQLLEQLFAKKGSVRLAMKSLIDSFPRLDWEVRSLVRTQLLEAEAFKIDDDSVGSLDDYTSEYSYVINSFIRDHSQFGQAEITDKWSKIVTVYNGPNFDYLNWNVGFVHPFQHIQWLIALSAPITSPTHVFRWGNGPERNEIASLQIGDSMTLAGYTSTTLIPWLTFQFSNPAYIRDHEALIYTDWNGLSSQRVFPPFDDEGEGVLYHYDIDPAADTPYGMMINLPSQTRCLYIISTQAEILLAHACTIQLTKRFTLQGGEEFEYRDIPFFVFDLIDDGIHFYDQ